MAINIIRWKIYSGKGRRVIKYVQESGASWPYLGGGALVDVGVELVNDLVLLLVAVVLLLHSRQVVAVFAVV